jgi:Flp pilus assembly pilin Flp
VRNLAHRQWGGKMRHFKRSVLLVALRGARLRRLLGARDGVTALEYGLIAGSTVVAISVFLPGMGTRLSGMFSAVSSAL